jgi:hypothetical protein
VAWPAFVADDEARTTEGAGADKMSDEATRFSPGDCLYAATRDMRLSYDALVHLKNDHT